MRRLIIICITLVYNFFLFGQAPQLPTVIPPSPQAQEFIKYIDYPVNLSSGLPEINVPIYTIKSKELSLPISISYHASGLKPNEDESGIIGLGWHLNAGGIISRSIIGKPDEKVWNQLIPQETDFTSTTDELVADPDANILDNLVRGYKESSPDIFSYSLPGTSGKFILKRSSLLSEFLAPVLLPFNPIKITPNLTSSVLDKFEVVDKNGVFYRFGKSISTGNTDVEIYYDMNDVNKNGTTSWLLTEIISADKSDTISFEYNGVQSYDDLAGLLNYMQKSHRTFRKTRRETNGGTAGDWPSPLLSGGPSSSFLYYSYTQRKITKIKFKQGEVRFIYKSNIYPNQLLDYIEIYSKTSTSPLQTIKLTQTKYHNTPGLFNWNKLDELGYYDANNTFIKKYSFKYNQSKVFPSIDDPISKETYSVDFWGFYNGASNSDGTLPAFYSNNLFGIADRNPNENYAMAGILNQITYPTGGIWTFEYEGNKVNRAIGGLRVKTITHKTGVQDTKRSFAYAGTSIPISMEYFMNNSISVYQSNLRNPPTLVVYNSTASSNPSININTLNGRPVLYTTVTEYDGDITTNNGWIEHKFDNSFVKAHVSYHHSSIRIGFPLGNGTTHMPYPVFYRNLILGNIFENETIIYDKSGNPLKKTLKSYSHNLIQRSNGFTVNRLVTSSIPGSTGTALRDKVYFYNFYNYNIDQLSQHLDSETTYDYPDNSGQAVTTTSSYKYNSNNLPISQITDKSNGEKMKITFTYPTEESCTNCPTLLSNHILTPVINRKNYLKTGSNEQLLHTLHTNYNNLGKPLLVQASTMTNPLQNEVIYSYDNNTQNISTVNKANNLKTTYLWGYNKTLPIAKVDNSALTSTDVQKTGTRVVTDVIPAGNNSLVGSFVLSSAYDNITLSITYNNLAGYPVKIKLDDNYIENTSFSPYSSTVTRNVSIGQLSKGSHRFYAEVSGTIPSNATVNMSVKASKTITYSYTETYTLPFHTSFEEDNTNINTSYFKTGEQCHTGSYKLQIPPITGENKQLVVSFWRKATSSSDWEYVEETFTAGGSLTTKTIGSGYAYIDEVRAYPDNAAMTTYTYAPLVGITSQTGPNGQSTYYEYDTFGRLKRIKDNDGKILKVYDYHYKQ